MAYTKTTWENSPSTATPISAANLNKMEEGIEDAHDHIAASSAVHGITNTANLVYTSDSRLSDQRTPSDGSVTAAKLATGAVTKEKLASSVAAQSLATQTGTSYTLALSDGDFGAMLLMNNSASTTVTVPPNGSVAFPVGSVVNLAQFGTGQVTIAPGSGVTVSSEGSKTKTAGRYAVASLLKVSTDAWILFGNTAA
jgi:hypothetical protein